MAIQPIDLQTLYTQIEKVGKTQVQQQHAAQIAQNSEQKENIKKADQQQKTIQGLDSGEHNSLIIRDKNKKTSSDSSKSKDQSDSKSNLDVEDGPETIKDPNLGNIIDISG